MKVSHLLVCLMVFTLSRHLNGEREKCSNLQSSILSIFRRLDLFLQVFGQIKVWLMLDMHKIIIASDILVFPITFFCFMSEAGREECSKLQRMIIF